MFLRTAPAEGEEIKLVNTFISLCSFSDFTGTGVGAKLSFHLLARVFTNMLGSERKGPRRRAEREGNRT